MTREQIEKIVIERYGDDPFDWGGQRDGMREVLNNLEKYGLISRERTFIIGGSLFDTLSTKSKRMTNEQNIIITTTLKEFGESLSDKLTTKHKKLKVSGFNWGAKEVVNNPSKYNLMPIPTEEEIDGWFGDGQEVHDRFWEEAPYRTNGDRVEEIKEAFEYFKNRTIEKAQDNNSGE